MGHGDLFFKSRITKIKQRSWHAPWALNRGVEQARQELRRVNREGDLFFEGYLLGLARLGRAVLGRILRARGGLKADLPFHVMKPAYAVFEKEIPMALQSTVGFLKELKC